MTGIDLIKQAILRLPNSFNDEQILDFLNQALHLNWKEISVVDVTTFPSFAEQAEYQLPPTIDENAIFKLWVNNKQYVPSDWENAWHGFYQVKTGVLSVNPPPANDGTIKVKHIFVPPDITLTDEIIGLRPNGEQVLLLDALVKMANSVSDIPKANTFRLEFNQALEDCKYKKEDRFAKFPTVKRANLWWAKR